MEPSPIRLLRYILVAAVGLFGSVATYYIKVAMLVCLLPLRCYILVAAVGLFGSNGPLSPTLYDSIFLPNDCISNY